MTAELLPIPPMPSETELRNAYHYAGTQLQGWQALWRMGCDAGITSTAAALAVPAGKGEAREQLIQKAAAAMRLHYLDPKNMGECICGDWSDDDMNPDDWDAHLAEAVADLFAPVAPIAVQGEGEEAKLDPKPWHPIGRLYQSYATADEAGPEGFRVLVPARGYSENEADYGVAVPAVQGVTADRRDELAKAIFLARNGGGAWMSEFEDDGDFTDAQDDADAVLAHFAVAPSEPTAVPKAPETDSEYRARTGCDCTHERDKHSPQCGIWGVPAAPKAPTPTREALTAWLREGRRWEMIRAKDEYDAADALLASDLWEGGE